MQPQGTAVTNPDAITNIIDQLNGITVCSDLQAEVNTVMASLNGTLAAIHAQIALLEALLVNPVNLPEVITWIQTFITQLTGPYTNYTLQLAAFTTEIASLIAAIEAAATRIGGGCSITIPTPDL